MKNHKSAEDDENMHSLFTASQQCGNAQKGDAAEHDEMVERHIHSQQAAKSIKLRETVVAIVGFHGCKEWKEV